MTNQEMSSLVLGRVFCWMQTVQVGHAMVRPQYDTERPTAGGQCVEHRARLIGRWKEFAGYLPFEFNAERRKPLGGFLHRKGGQHIPHQMARPEKVVGGYYIMSDIAAPTA